MRTCNLDRYRIGGTLGDDVRVFAGICQAVIDQVDAWLAGGVISPTAGL